jgi:hypothetical protein
MEEGASTISRCWGDEGNRRKEEARNYFSPAIFSDLKDWVEVSRQTILRVVGQEMDLLRLFSVLLLWQGGAFSSRSVFVLT